MRRINAAGLSHIKSWEGKELKAYRCPANKWTIGYGSTGSHVRPGMVITEAEAEALLRKDLDRFERRVDTLVRVPINDNQFAALVSFDFNCGALHSSTLLKKLNAGLYAAVPGELMKWTKATVNGRKVTLKGLVNRRTSEVGLWKSMQVSEPAPVAPARPVPVPPAPKPTSKPKPAPVAVPGPKHWLAAIIGFFADFAKKWLGRKKN